MTEFDTRKLAREISSVAHGRAIHALWPLITVCDRERRDAVYTLLAREFTALDDTLEALLGRER